MDGLFVDDDHDYDKADLFDVRELNDECIQYSEGEAAADDDEYSEGQAAAVDDEYSEGEAADDDDADSEETDSDMEHVPLEPQSYLITIGNGRTETDKIKTRKVNRTKRLAIHNMGMIAYLVMAWKRNQLIQSKRVLKVLKRLVPKLLMADHIKPFKKLLVAPKNPQDSNADTRLIYILKYLIKWFQLNYQVDSNGLRVLGYVPDSSGPDSSDPKDFFPPPPKTRIGSVSDFLRVIKRFKHNRDTGSLIFTGILRALGFEARMVFSVPLLSPSSTAGSTQPKNDLQLLRTNKDNDLLYPYFWTEVVNPLNPNEILVLEPICFHEQHKQLLRNRRITGSTYSFRKDMDYIDFFNPCQRNPLNIMPPSQYVASIDSKGLILDVSPRYMTDVAYRYFGRLDLRSDTGRSTLLFQTVLRRLNGGVVYNEWDNKELDTLRNIAFANLTLPKSLSGLRRNPNIVTKQTLRYNEALRDKSRSLTKIKLKDGYKVKVYLGKQVLYGRTEYQWKLLARSVRPDQIEHPIKSKNNLSRTIKRKKLDGLLSPLYNFEQTCPYIKQEVCNGKIPRNQYGNIEIFNSVMIPTDCTWVKWTYVERILGSYNKKKKENATNPLIEYVPVVVGFDFKSKPGHAIPIRHGVLVLSTQLFLVKHIWFSGKLMIDRHNIRLKKMNSLNHWRTLLSQIRIKKRLDLQYGTIQQWQH